MHNSKTLLKVADNKQLMQKTAEKNRWEKGEKILGNLRMQAGLG